MSLLSYQLQLKRYQRELGLDYRTFNALDVKHSDINLLKQLQLLNPIVSASAPATKTGFWGTFRVNNEKDYNSVPRYMTATLGYNDIVIDGPQQINSDEFYIFTIPIEDRAPSPSSTIQLKVTFQSGVGEAADANITGFSITGWTGISLQEENTLSMLIDENNINEGFCSMTWIVVTD